MPRPKRLQLLSEQEAAPSEEEPQPPRLVTCQLADAICSKERFARDEGNALYYYRNGVYLPGGEDRLRACVKHYLRDESRSSEWTARKVYEVERYIADDAPRILPRPPQDARNYGHKP